MNNSYGSNLNRDFNPNGSSGGNGSGGYNPPPNDPYLNAHYLQNDANRQIMIVLLRLQQDTQNVLTRLSYLENSVMSIQNSMQMSRIENSIQLQVK